MKTREKEGNEEELNLRRESRKLEDCFGTCKVRRHTKKEACYPKRLDGRKGKRKASLSTNLFWLWTTNVCMCGKQKKSHDE